MCLYTFPLYSTAGLTFSPKNPELQRSKRKHSVTNSRPSFAQVVLGMYSNFTFLLVPTLLESMSCVSLAVHRHIGIIETVKSAVCPSQTLSQDGRFDGPTKCHLYKLNKTRKIFLSWSPHLAVLLFFSSSVCATDIVVAPRLAFLSRLTSTVNPKYSKPCYDGQCQPALN